MTRQMARRPTYGDASRFVTSACSGWPGSYTGRRDVLEQRLEQRLEVVGQVVGAGVRRPALARVAVDDRELDLVVARVEVEEQRVRLVDDLG